MKADLHNHSYYSDGVFSPSEVVRFADDAGCDLFALTDHDKNDWLDEAQHMADKLSVDLVSGVEISAFWRNMTIHIIGLDIDIKYDIIIIGSGPVGLSLAKALSLLDLRICIVDQQTEAILSSPLDDGREVAITHLSKKILSELGTWQLIDYKIISLIKEA